MSVPEGKRSKGKLAIETDVMRLLDYIFNITAKYYRPFVPVEGEDNTDAQSEHEQAKWFAEKMRNEVSACICHVQEANRIHIVDEQTLSDRRNQQGFAERSLENLLSSATVMYKKKKLKSKKLKKIAEDVLELKQKIQNWRKSDNSRYKADCFAQSHVQELQEK